MKIKKLTLKGYKRLALNNIHEFHIDCEQDVQIILGMNGCGKSSVLFELSPLPANSSDFKKDGKKIIVIEAKGLTYTLINDFSIHNGHSFEVEGEELNPGGTISVQRELVKNLFNITISVRELMTTSLGFHSMSTSARRQWFTQLCDTSYEYALSVYNNAKQKHRDTLGALKIAKKRFVLQSESGTTDTEQTQLKSGVDSLHEFISHLIEHRGIKAEHEADVVLTDVLKNEDIIKKLCSIFGKTHLGLNKEFHGLSTSNLQETKNKKVVESQILNKTKNEYLQTLQDMKFKIEAIELNSKFDTQQICEEKLIIEEEKIKIIKSFIILDDYKKVNDIKNTFQSVYPQLCELFKELPPNEQNQYSREKLSEHKKQYDQTSVEILTVKSELARLSTFIANQEHLKEHNSATCPQCNHKWIIGFNEHHYKKALRTQDIKNTQLITLEDKQQKLLNFIQQTENYGFKLKEYKTITVSSPSLSCLWQYLSQEKQNNLMNSCPSLLIPILIGFNEELDNAQMLLKMDIRLDEINDLLVIAQRVKDDDTTKVIEENNFLTEKSHLIMRELIELDKDIQKIDNEIKDRIFLDETAQSLNTLIDMNLSIENKVKQIYRKNAIDEIIKAAQLKLAEKQTLLSNITAHKAILTDLEKSITELQIQENALSIIVNELSPTDGLIAMGMTGFIKMFVSQMNKVIKQVWSYPLLVHPCRIEEDGTGELNYKFPIQVNNEPDHITDVSMGSTGIREIIDFAFKITALINLGLTNSPIYLDELGRTMDSEHKIKVIEFIKQMSQTNMFSQIFMVSHDIVHYGALPNAQICVLCEANITLPKSCVFNKHVTLN